ncbi:thiamine pyrophosphate-binding protein [bacterium]|nr:thiamine pyrophosphate-binding protein [bacterium]
MNKLSVADYVFRFLADRGATVVFVLTGNGSMYVNDAIAREPRLDYVCARNEAAAPIMASAFAKVSGKIGVVSVTSGPGATNAVPGLAEAWVESSPVVIISGQSPIGELPRGSGDHALRTFGTAGVDVVPAVRAFTKYASTVTDPATIRYEIEKAYHLAVSGRPGPVWLDIPIDVQSAHVDAESLVGFSPKSRLDPVSSEDIRAFESILQSAERPLIVAGQGVRQSGALVELEAVVRDWNVPVALSRLGQDIFPRSMELNLGQIGRRGAPYSKSLLLNADVIIAVGCRLSVQLAGHDLEHFSSDAKVVMIDIDSAEIEKFGERIALPIVADAKDFLRSVLSDLSPTSSPSWEDWRTRCKNLKSTGKISAAQRESNPMDLYFFMTQLDRVSGPQNIFITDAGSNYYVGGQVYNFEHGQREVTSGTFAAMGTSLPLSIGAAVASPEKQILAVTGDGSLELNIQELKTISYYALNVKVFVINNGGYVSMRNWQDSFFEGRRIGSDDETGAEGLDFRAVAQAFGLDYMLLDSAESVVEDLSSLISNPGPMFIEVLCDTEQKIVQPFVETEISS